MNTCTASVKFVQQNSLLFKITGKFCPLLPLPVCLFAPRSLANISSIHINCINREVNTIFCHYSSSPRLLFLFFSPFTSLTHLAPLFTLISGKEKEFTTRPAHQLSFSSLSFLFRLSVASREIFSLSKQQQQQQQQSLVSFNLFNWMCHFFHELCLSVGSLCYNLCAFFVSFSVSSPSSLSGCCTFPSRTRA